jgi:hypothetical protein
MTYRNVEHKGAALVAKAHDKLTIWINGTDEFVTVLLNSDYSLSADVGDTLVLSFKNGRVVDVQMVAGLLKGYLAPT